MDTYGICAYYAHNMHILSTLADHAAAAPRERLVGSDLVRLADWQRDDVEAALDLAGLLKDLQARREPHPYLAGRSIGLIFAKHSTRTRVSFEVGISQLGGTAVTLDASTTHLGRGEPIRDTAYVLSRYLDCIVIRTFAHADVEELAEHADIPVVNALTDAAHPCQALADLLTIKERLGGLEGVRVAWVGDGNNVFDSLADGCLALGVDLVAACPAGYGPARTDVEVADDPRDAVAGADVVCTDVWTSMGQEAEREKRLRDFAGFMLDDDLLSLASPDAIALHCLPAHCGEEISESVLYGPQSAVWDQAENRLHVQKALLSLIVP
jgi:ornithine carbamoyltransferase